MSAIMISLTDPAPAAQAEMPMQSPAPVQQMADAPCECEQRAAAAYRRYVIIQVCTILFYLLMIAVLLKVLFRK